MKILFFPHVRGSGSSFAKYLSVDHRSVHLSLTRSTLGCLNPLHRKNSTFTTSSRFVSYIKTWKWSYYYSLPRSAAILQYCKFLNFVLTKFRSTIFPAYSWAGSINSSSSMTGWYVNNHTLPTYLVSRFLFFIVFLEILISFFSSIF